MKRFLWFISLCLLIAARAHPGPPSFLEGAVRAPENPSGSYALLISQVREVNLALFRNFQDCYRSAGPELRGRLEAHISQLDRVVVAEGERYRLSLTVNAHSRSLPLEVHVLSTGVLLHGEPLLSECPRRGVNFMGRSAMDPLFYSLLGAVENPRLQRVFSALLTVADHAPFLLSDRLPWALRQLPADLHARLPFLSSPEAAAFGLAMLRDPHFVRHARFILDAEANLRRLQMPPLFEIMSPFQITSPTSSDANLKFPLLNYAVNRLEFEDVSACLTAFNEAFPPETEVFSIRVSRLPERCDPYKEPALWSLYFPEDRIYSQVAPYSPVFTLSRIASRSLVGAETATDEVALPTRSESEWHALIKHLDSYSRAYRQRTLQRPIHHRLAPWVYSCHARHDGHDPRWVEAVGYMAGAAYQFFDVENKVQRGMTLEAAISDAEQDLAQWRSGLETRCP